MELQPRDLRHLKGTTPRVTTTPPPARGLVVDAGWRSTGPYLTVRDDAGASHALRLDGDLNLEVLDERRCVGRWVDGRSVPCPFDAPADHFDQCPACHPLPDRECVFNPRCADCPHEFCHSPHRLYLAFYGALPKVGMTRAARGDLRLIEQGADAFAFLATVPDRFEARRMEDLVTRRLGVPQARRPQELLTAAARPAPWAAIEARHAGLARRAGDLLGTAPGPLVRAPPDPAFPLPVVPTLAGIVGHHAGTIVAAKGRYLFYRADASTQGDPAATPIWALNLGAVTTHRVHYEPRHTLPA